jgi:succinate dehydrogenase / fumarate reductase cytochrome b subunit
MLDWVRRTFRSSIGKKLLVAVTGLLLIGFLVVHLTGNLLIYGPEEGAAFGKYAETLESSPLLPVAEILLAALFVAHIAMALRVTTQNRDARASRYRIRSWHGGRTPGSATMVVTGLVVLVFLLIHIYDFRLQKDDPHELAEMVRARLGGGVGFLIYVVGVGALTLHLSHAAQSALQTLGINHPKYTPALRALGVVLALALGVGFVSFPLVFFFGGNA